MSRERIKEASLELFRRYSYVKTSVSDIAKASGIGKGTIYLSFKTKEEILFALLDDEIAKLHVRDDVFFFDATKPLSEKLTLFVTNLLELHFMIRDLMFGSFENVQGKELQDVYHKFEVYVSQVIDFWVQIVSLHGYPKTETLKQQICELVLFLSGRFVVYILSHDWNSREEIRTLMPLWAQTLFRALVTKENT